MATALTEEERSTLIKLAKGAKDHSYSPYSKFRVGAALLTEEGKYFIGCNVENASYGGCICAERTAVVKAVSEGYRKFKGIAVTTDIAEPASPCGMCRQFLREFFASNIPIIMFSSTDEVDQKVQTLTMEELLPLGFGPEDLEKPRKP